MRTDAVHTASVLSVICIGFVYNMHCLYCS